MKRRDGTMTVNAIDGLRLTACPRGQCRSGSCFRKEIGILGFRATLWMVVMVMMLSDSGHSRKLPRIATPCFYSTTN